MKIRINKYQSCEELEKGTVLKVIRTWEHHYGLEKDGLYYVINKKHCDKI